MTFITAESSPMPRLTARGRRLLHRLIECSAHHIRINNRECDIVFQMPLQPRGLLPVRLRFGSIVIIIMLRWTMMMMVFPGTRVSITIFLVSWRRWDMPLLVRSAMRKFMMSPAWGAFSTSTPMPLWSVRPRRSTRDTLCIALTGFPPWHVKPIEKCYQLPWILDHSLRARTEGKHTVDSPESVYQYQLATRDLPIKGDSRVSIRAMRTECHISYTYHFQQVPVLRQGFQEKH